MRNLFYTGSLYMELCAIYIQNRITHAIVVNRDEL